jgi:hypothetical protein
LTFTKIPANIRSQNKGNTMSKKIVKEFEIVGTEELPMDIKETVKFTGITIRTEPMTDDFID